MQREKKPTRYSHLSWGPIAAILGSLGVFFGAQIIVGIGIYVVLSVLGWDEGRIQQWLSGGNQAQFIISVAVATATLGLLYVFLQSRKAHPDELGLAAPKPKDLLYVLYGAVLYIMLYLGVVSVLSGLLPGLDTEQTQELGFTVGSSDTLLIIFIALVVLPPIVEEVVVRGFLFAGLRKGFSFWPAAIVSSLLFGLAHLQGGEGGSTIWIAFIDTAILGMILAYLREKTGRIWASIGLHALKNGVAFLALFVFNLG